MDRQREYKKSRDPFTSEAAKFKRAEKTESRRRQQRDKNVSQRRKLDENHNTTSTDGEETLNDMSVKLMKWKEEKALQKKLEAQNKKPIFKIGIPHHNLYSPPLNDDKLQRNHKKTKNPIDTKQKKISRVTERRLALKGAAGEARCTRASKKLAAATTAADNKQPVDPKNPVVIAPTPLFGQFEIPMEPDTSNEQSNKHDATFVLEKNTSNDEKYMDAILEDENEDEEKNKLTNDANNSIESVMLRVSSQESLDSNEIHDKQINNKHLNIQDKCASPIAALFSPFITTSRGKSSARKEFKERMSLRTSCSPADDIPTKDTVMKNLNISVDEEEHTAQYYRSLGERESNRLKELCNDWRIIQFLDDTPEESIHHINSAIGQAELLLNKKFGRFQQLVDNCEDGKGEMLVRCRDLQGFWELVSREVADCDSRFYKLEILRNNDWIEKEEEDTEVYRKPINKKKNIVKKKLNTAKSKFKLFIEEQRKKKLQEQMDIDAENDENIEENNNQQIIPKKSLLSSETFVPSSPILTPRSLMRRQLTDSAKKMALASMKITQICKTPEVQLDDSISYVNSHQTPGKGILKKFNFEFPISEKQITKSTCKVNFNDTVDENKIISLEKKKLTFDDSLSPDEPLLDDSIKSSSNNFFFKDPKSDIISKEINKKIPSFNLISPTPRKQINPKIPSITLTSPTPRTQRVLPIINITSATVDRKLRKKTIKKVTDSAEEVETPRQLRNRSIKFDATPSASKKSRKTFDTSQLDLSVLSTSGIVDKENNVQKKKSTARKSIKYEDVGNMSLNIPSTPRKSNRLSMKHASDALSVTLPSTPITPRRKRKI
ncbi:uncharacterized protein LOC122849364 [Aphidius gifuensis]|uniref:uncharacterized protein LOC122849364 n=1 Tax=Aphidius gifuensis TaxID=684658 RepID=UPI001CDC09DA|nr:uncharacterized protein LOC122849364 [Aphidius gifuensis]